MPIYLVPEPAETILTALTDALDNVNQAIVLLNRNMHVSFINRRFGEICPIPATVLARGPTFRELLENAAASGLYDLPAADLPDYLNEREAAVRAGCVPASIIETTHHQQILFNCKVCPDGGRILTYTDISEQLQREVSSAAARITAELRFNSQLLEEQGAQLATLAEAADENAKRAEAARLLLEHEVAERRQLEIRLRRLATTDGLTGALNRVECLALAQKEMDARQNSETKIVVLMIDVDHFKAINDRFGHAGGDLALQQLVVILQAGLRQTDLVGRLGGEEFAVILPDTPRGPAEAVAERLRARVAETQIIFGNQHIHMTISVGLASQLVTETSIEQVIARADDALYRAKRSGRNRVVTDEEMSDTTC